MVVSDSLRSCSARRDVVAGAIFASWATRSGKALTSLVNGAIDALPGWHYTSISVAARDGSLKTLAATDQWIVQCDDFQGELRQGPCYDALIDGTYTFALDLRHDGRWPDYGPMVANLGITSQMALFLSEEPGLRASLNLYAKSRVDLDQDALEVAQLFANAAAGVLGMVRTVEQLTEALATRRTIGQAMGIVMERYTIDDEQAFRFLTRLSQTTNTKLRLVAEDLVRGALGRAHSIDLPKRADRTD